MLTDIDTLDAPEILDAILKLFPLDTYVEHPVNLIRQSYCNKERSALESLHLTIRRF